MKTNIIIALTILVPIITFILGSKLERNLGMYQGKDVYYWNFKYEDLAKQIKSYQEAVKEMQ